jgi:hypothetical protein
LKFSFLKQTLENIYLLNRLLYAFTFFIFHLVFTLISINIIH